MKQVWLLYDAQDLAVNRDYARMMRQSGFGYELSVQPVALDELSLAMDERGVPFCLRNGVRQIPDAILSRQRSALVSEHFERMGVPVFNSSRVCDICNDKRRTHQFLQGLPMPASVFLLPGQTAPDPSTCFPVILKPACSHGGDRVSLCRDEHEWQEAAQRILPEPALQQSVVSDAGRDLRVYVLNGEILAGVMRTAQTGVVSNFKKGGHVALHALTAEESALAEAVIRRFDKAGARLYMAGVDLLYDHGHPVVGEVEDVVGSRMLYQTSDLDIVTLYLGMIAQELANRS